VSAYAARLSWVKPFFRRTSVKNLLLTRLVCSRRADRSSARMVSNSSALRARQPVGRVRGFYRRAASSAPYTPSNRSAILTTDRRPVGYGTDCNFQGKTVELRNGRNTRRIPPKLNRASATDLQRQRKRNTTEITPFIVKNAAFSLLRSSWRTSMCSYSKKRGHGDHSPAANLPSPNTTTSATSNPKSITM